MGTCIAKTGHTCGTIQGLQVYETERGGVDGYCWSCDTYVPNPYGEPLTPDDIPKAERTGLTEEEIAEKLEEIGTYPVVDLLDRRLRADSLDHFGVKIGLSEQDGHTPTFHYYPYYRDGTLVSYKARLIEGKKLWSIGDQREVDLFGWPEAVATGAKRLVVTEGECDAVALYRIIDLYCDPKYRDAQPAVVSIPHGAGGAVADFTRLKDKIKRHFKEVTLCFDDDDSGRDAMTEVCKVFPDWTTVTLPSKDANQCILDGTGKAAYKAVAFNAQRPKNTSLVLGESLHQAGREPAKYGELTWPWEHINKVTRAIRYGETIYIGAGVKMGKSEILNSIAAHFIKAHEVKVFMAKPEEANLKTYKMMAGKMVGGVFHDPDREFDYDAYDQAGELLEGKLGMVNLYQHLGWDTLKGDIYAAANWGAKAVFIDPITNLTNGIAAGDANVELQRIAQDSMALALDLDIVVFLFCHLKAHDGFIGREAREKAYNMQRYLHMGNCPHEFGGDIYSNQFAGSRAMARSCNLMIGVSGNKDPELPVEVRNIRSLDILEDREFGNAGSYPIYWNPNTQLYKGVGK